MAQKKIEQLQELELECNKDDEYKQYRYNPLLLEEEIIKINKQLADPEVRSK